MVDYNLSNIIAQFNISSSTHLLVGAHWDTRPWADNDLNFQQHDQPIIGANDGASGVSVILELARIFHKTPPPIGVFCQRPASALHLRLVVSDMCIRDRFFFINH